MGVIENKVFLSMEDTLAAKVRVLVNATVGPDITTAAKLIGQGQFDAARAVVEGFDVSQELLTLEGMIRVKFIQNALFGASQITEPEQSVLMTKPFLLDNISNMILQHNAIINNGLAKVKSIAFRMIQNAEEGQFPKAVGDGIIKSWGGHVHIQKAGETISELAVLFNNAVDGNMNALVDLGANLTTSRMISYGFLQEASSVGILSYEVSAILDDRTCPVCEFIHGTVFTVEKALAQTTRVLNTTDPNELKSMAPFPGQSKAALAELREMSADDLASEGFHVPPYHPLCRCILVEVGRDTGEADVDIIINRPRPRIGTVTQIVGKPPKVVQPPQVAVAEIVPEVRIDLQTFGAVEAGTVTALEETLAALPQGVRKTVFEKGWKVQLSEDILVSPDSFIANMAPRGWPVGSSYKEVGGWATAGNVKTVSMMKNIQNSEFIWAER